MFLNASILLVITSSMTTPFVREVSSVTELGTLFLMLEELVSDSKFDLDKVLLKITLEQKGDSTMERILRLTLSRSGKCF